VDLASDFNRNARLRRAFPLENGIFDKEEQGTQGSPPKTPFSPNWHPYLLIYRSANPITSAALCRSIYQPVTTHQLD
jgi:hypothetical protein